MGLEHITEAEIRTDAVRADVVTRRWCFANVQVCAVERRLWVNDAAVDIDRSALDILVTLLIAGGELVPRSELLRVGWPSRVVTENSVSKAVSRIRAAIGDVDSQLIVSDHGFGYRVRRPVHYLPTTAPSPGSALGEIQLPAVSAPASLSDDTEHAATMPRKKRSGWLPIASLILLAAALAGGIWRQSINATRAPENPAGASSQAASVKPVIAVLPFASAGADVDQQAMARGLSLQLAEALSRVPQLQVVAPPMNAATPVDVREIGRDFNADVVLQGEVFGSAKRLRVALRLIRASNSALLWAHQFDRQVSDSFATQDEIALAVIAALRIELLPEQIKGMARRPTTSPEAYAQFLLAEELFKDDETGGRRALAAYERAVALDPEFSDAWYRIADLLGHNGFYSDSPAEALAGKRRALAIVETELNKHPMSAEFIGLHGAFMYSHWWDWNGAQADYRKLAGLVGEDDEILLLNRSRIEAALGHLDGAIALALRAAEVNPSSTGWALAGYQALGEGRINEAQNWISKTILAQPLDEHAHYYLGLSKLLSGRPAEALESFDDSAHVLRLTGRAAALYSLHRELESKAELARLIELYAHVDSFRVAQVYAWRGETDQAFAWLTRAHEQHEASMMYLPFDPLLASLRVDPRFAAALRAVNLPVAAAK